MADDPSAPVPTALNAVPLGGDATDVDLYLKPEKFGDVFLSDRLGASRTRVLAATQRPATAASGNEPTQAVAWKTVPSWYLVPTDDRTIGTDNLRFMAERTKATTVEADAPHAVMDQPGRCHPPDPARRGRLSAQSRQDRHERSDRGPRRHGVARRRRGHSDRDPRPPRLTSPSRGPPRGDARGTGSFRNDPSPLPLHRPRKRPVVRRGPSCDHGPARCACDSSGIRDRGGPRWR